MTGQAAVRLMPDGRRLHMQHGPIDIIAEAFGSAEEISKSYKQGAEFFGSVLETLVVDLSELKKPLEPNLVPEFKGTALTMWRAANLFLENNFVTSMAAVAGAVADGVKQAMLKGRHLEKLYVNNGGDISIYLSGDATFTSAIVNNPDNPSVNAELTLKAADQIGGIATSGWRGRSYSRGIADAVTVLARTAAIADVAATLIANDVFLKSSNIRQEPANSLDDSADLGEILVTVSVDKLTEIEITSALNKGEETAQRYKKQGLIDAAYLALQGQSRIIGANNKIWGGNAA